MHILKTGFLPTCLMFGYIRKVDILSRTCVRIKYVNISLSYLFVLVCYWTQQQLFLCKEVIIRSLEKKCLMLL